MENICNAEDSSSTFYRVYFSNILVCMIVYHFVGFGSVFIFPVWEFICCVLVTLSRSCTLTLKPKICSHSLWF